MDFKYFLFAFAGLFAGSILAGFIVPLIPIELSGWMQGIFIGIVQMVILVMLGAVASRGLMPVLIGGILIFIGGIIGGFVSGIFGFTDWYGTIIVLFVQVLVLMFTGYIKGSKAAVHLGKLK